MKNAQAFAEGKITDFSAVGVKALDDQTLEVSLENPTPFFLIYAPPRRCSAGARQYHQGIWR